MRNATTLGAALLAGVLVIAGTGCNKLKARDHINQGAAAFKSAKYQEAVEHFKTAIELDPDLPTARQYLATSYMVQWIPGAESPENKQFADMAESEFNKILEKDPNDRAALTSLAYMAFNKATSLPQEEKMAKFDEATKLYQRLIATDPNNKDNKEAYYTLAVVGYQKWNPALMLARANLRMKVEDPGPLKDKKVKEELKEKYSAVIDDAIQNLQKALDIDPEYDDAMAYMNLMVRTKADLLDDEGEYKKQIEVADNWLQKTLDTKKMKAARAEKSNVGITQEEAK